MLKRTLWLCLWLVLVVSFSVPALDFGYLKTLPSDNKLEQLNKNLVVVFPKYPGKLDKAEEFGHCGSYLAFHGLVIVAPTGKKYILTDGCVNEKKTLANGRLAHPSEFDVYFPHLDNLKLTVRKIKVDEKADIALLPASVRLPAAVVGVSLNVFADFNQLERGKKLYKLGGASGEDQPSYGSTLGFIYNVSRRFQVIVSKMKYVATIGTPVFYEDGSFAGMIDLETVDTSPYGWIGAEAPLTEEELDSYTRLVHINPAFYLKIKVRQLLKKF